jgi:hypothetical protein
VIALILNKARSIFEAECSLVDIPLEDQAEITVCGDIHG